MADGSAKVKCPHCGKVFAVRLGPQPAPAPGPMPMDLAEFELAIGGGAPAAPSAPPSVRVPVPPA
ncbi:MAG: hypothetical protein HY608_01225, partial [Planctomycetes bacterium]|nr:hypothetical protein [Planctomycetota bacterium]